MSRTPTNIVENYGFTPVGVGVVVFNHLLVVPHLIGGYLIAYGALDSGRLLVGLPSLY